MGAGASAIPVGKYSAELRKPIDGSDLYETGDYEFAKSEATRLLNELGKYVTRLDTYVRRQNDTSNPYIVDSTGGLVTKNMYMSGSYEVKAKIDQRSGLVFAMWLFNGAKTWSQHVAYPDGTCEAPNSGCQFFNSSQCVSSDKDHCPFDASLNKSSCEHSPGGTYVEKGAAPFTCMDNSAYSYQNASKDPMWIDRSRYPGNILPQICKEFPNSEIDWEIPSNAPQTTRGCTPSTPCDFVSKYV